LRELPTVWDETRLIAGEPGRYVVLAREKGNRRYMAAINGTDKPLSVSIPADRVERASAILDDGDGGLKEQTLTPNDEGVIELKLPPRGGAVITDKV
jgi:hypothetical protein